MMGLTKYSARATSDSLCQNGFLYFSFLNFIHNHAVNKEIILMSVQSGKSIMDTKSSVNSLKKKI